MAASMTIDKKNTRERLSFTLFLAIAVHAIVILGVVFSMPDKSKIAPTINITLATHQADTRPEEADYLAQFDQQASGTKEQARELTSTEISEVVAPSINKVTPVPQQKSVLESAKNDQYVTTIKNDFQIQKLDEEDDQSDRERLEAEQEDTPYLNPEIASLRAKLDKLQQEFARRPRIRRMTSVATKSAADAAYLNKWTQKVEIVGNQNFPRAAIDQQIFGSLRMSVIINADGTLEGVEILKPSGFPVLDQAALQIIHLSAPFDPFPSEIRRDTDQLDIIRTWRFEITGLSTQSAID